MYKLLANKFSLRERVIGIFVFLYIVLLVLPLSWVSFTNITVDWVTFTEEWYKVLLTSFVSSVLFGFVVFLLIDSWGKKIEAHEINELIIKQKTIAKQILSNCNNEDIRKFLSNHDRIIPHCPKYLEGTIKGHKFFIIRQMHFYINTHKNSMYKEKAKNDIIKFCRNFT